MRHSNDLSHMLLHITFIGQKPPCFLHHFNSRYQLVWSITSSLWFFVFVAWVGRYECLLPCTYLFRLFKTINRHWHNFTECIWCWNFWIYQSRKIFHFLYCWISQMVWLCLDWHITACYGYEVNWNNLQLKEGCYCVIHLVLMLIVVKIQNLGS